MSNIDYGRVSTSPTMDDTSTSLNWWTKATFTQKISYVFIGLIFVLIPTFVGLDAAGVFKKNSPVNEETTTATSSAAASTNTAQSTYTSATTISSTTTVETTQSTTTLLTPEDFDDIATHINGKPCADYTANECLDTTTYNWIYYVCAATCNTPYLHSNKNSNSLLQHMLSNSALTCSQLQGSTGYCYSSDTWYNFITPNIRAVIKFSCPETCLLPIVNPV